MGRDSLFSILFANKRKRYTKTTTSQHWLRKYTYLTIGLKIEFECDLSFENVEAAYQKIELSIQNILMVVWIFNARGS
jgi:hypothetical protein